ncbi:hypothetical protein PR048_002980 [Dryococelus australis]|uniref:Uncharacterized protein n=1 Tax=Dryococelus australis TaxID=614101 RepID=A0ABQ9ILS4_9NEOP|nr:hypothetical protein PR048_002980 [Dryococelus australis]
MSSSAARSADVRRMLRTMFHEPHADTREERELPELGLVDRHPSRLSHQKTIGPTGILNLHVRIGPGCGPVDQPPSWICMLEWVLGVDQRMNCHLVSVILNDFVPNTANDVFSTHTPKACVRAYMQWRAVLLAFTISVSITTHSNDDSVTHLPRARKSEQVLAYTRLNTSARASIYKSNVRQFATPYIHSFLYLIKLYHIGRSQCLHTAHETSPLAPADTTEDTGTKMAADGTRQQPEAAPSNSRCKQKTSGNKMVDGRNKMANGNNMMVDGKITRWWIANTRWPKIFDEKLNVERYSEFLQHALMELLEDVPLATRLLIRLQQDGCLAHFSLVAKCTLQRFPGRWIGRGGPLTWPPHVIFFSLAIVPALSTGISSTAWLHLVLHTMCSIAADPLQMDLLPEPEPTSMPLVAGSSMDTLAKTQPSSRSNRLSLRHRGNPCIKEMHSSPAGRRIAVVSTALPRKTELVPPHIRFPPEREIYFGLGFGYTPTYGHRRLLLPDEADFGIYCHGNELKPSAICHLERPHLPVPPRSLFQPPIKNVGERTRSSLLSVRDTKCNPWFKHRRNSSPPRAHLSTASYCTTSVRGLGTGSGQLQQQQQQPYQEAPWATSSIGKPVAFCHLVRWTAPQESLPAIGNVCYVFQMRKFKGDSTENRAHIALLRGGRAESVATGILDFHPLAGKNICRNALRSLLFLDDRTLLAGREVIVIQLFSRHYWEIVFRPDFLSNSRKDENRTRTVTQPSDYRVAAVESSSVQTSSHSRLSLTETNNLKNDVSLRESLRRRPGTTCTAAIHLHKSNYLTLQPYAHGAKLEICTKSEEFELLKGHLSIIASHPTVFCFSGDIRKSRLTSYLPTWLMIAQPYSTQRRDGVAVTLTWACPFSDWLRETLNYCRALICERRSHILLTIDAILLACAAVARGIRGCLTSVLLTTLWRNDIPVRAGQIRQDVPSALLAPIFVCRNSTKDRRRSLFRECIPLYLDNVGHSGQAISTLASHQDEPGSIPDRVTGYSQVGIVPEDAFGWRVFSRIFRFPPPLHSGAASYSIKSPTSALKTSLLRATQISSIIHANWKNFVIKTKNYDLDK